MNKERRGAIRGAMGLFAVIVALQAVDVVLGTSVFWSHDLRHHHLPWREWAAGEWGVGTVRLWASQVGMGFPLMADGQIGVFYPVNAFLGQIFSGARALSLGLLLHQWWAALGTWWLCRSLGRSELASRLAGVGFALSGFYVSHFTYAGLQHVAAWIPWGMCALLQLGGERTFRWWFLWALSVAAMLTAGHPQMAVIGLLGCAWVFFSQRPSKALWGWVSAGLVLGVACALPQLLASLELAELSSRAGGTEAAFGAIGSLPPQELVNAGLPRFWGWETPADLPLSYIHKGPGYFGTGESHWENCFYLGFPILLLFLWSLTRGGVRSWKALALVSLVLMLGRATPLYSLLRQLPGMDYFRFPVRFAVLFTLAANVVAAAGLDSLRRNAATLNLRRIGRVIAWGLVAFAAVMTVAHQLLGVYGQELRARLALLAGPDGAERAGSMLQGLLVSTDPGSLPFLWVVMIVLAFLVLLRGLSKRLSGAAFSTGILALVVLDLSVFGSGYNARASRAEVQATPASAAMVTGEAGLYRTTVLDRVQVPTLDKELMSASLGSLYGTRDVFLPSPLSLPRNEALLAAAGLDLGIEAGRAKVQRFSARLALSELMGLRYLVTVHSLDLPRLSLVHQGRVRVYRNDSAQSRAFLAHCVEVVEGPEAALETMLEVDLRQWAVVEEEIALPCEEGAGSVQVQDYTSRSVQIAVDTEKEALLVLTDTWYPGWRARVDGEPVPVYRTDLAFRGVLLAPGERRVEFDYIPAWSWAVPLGLGSWVLLLLSPLVPRLRRRRQSAPG